MNQMIAVKTQIKPPAVMTAGLLIDNFNKDV
jgi:hypothetical protein